MLSRKLDHEAVNKNERADNQGRIFINPLSLSQNERDDLQESRKKHKAAAARRKAEHGKSLAANLAPTSSEQEAAQLRGLREVLAAQPPSDRLRIATLTKDIQRLETRLRNVGVKKLK